MKKINIFLMLSLCILLGGCKSAKEEKAMTREKVKQVMLDYIENKYDEEFEVFGMDYKSWDNGGVETMYAYPKGKNPNYYFYVERTRENKITDDYVIFTMQEVYEKKAKKIIKKYYPNAIVTVGIANSGPVPDNFRPNMDFDKFARYANKSVTFGCSIYLVAESEEDLDEKKVKQLEEELRKVNDVGKITFLGYSAKGFDQYISHDPFNTQEENRSYSTNGMNFEKDLSWGAIDIEYEYKEE